MKADKRFITDVNVLLEPVSKEEWLPWSLDRIALGVLGICGLALGALIQYLFASAVIVLAAIGGGGVLGLAITYTIIIVAMADDTPED